MQRKGYFTNDDYYNHAQEVLYCRVPWKGNLKRNRSMVLAAKEYPVPRSYPYSERASRLRVSKVWLQYSKVYRDRCYWKWSTQYIDRALQYGRLLDE